MAHVEVGRIEKRVPCQSLCRLRIFGCRRVESDTGRLDRIKSAAVGESVLAGELDRVHVATSQLGRLRCGLCLCGIERVEVQAIAFPAQIKNEPEIVAGTLPVAVDFHGGRARFYGDGEFLFGFGFGGHSVENVRQLSENCPKSATDFARLRFNTLPKRHIKKCRRRGSNPHSRREHDFESCASASSATPAKVRSAARFGSASQSTVRNGERNAEFCRERRVTGGGFAAEDDWRLTNPFRAPDRRSTLPSW